MLRREETNKNDKDIRFVQKKRIGNEELVVGIQNNGRPVILDRHLIEPTFTIKMLVAKYSLCIYVFFYILLLFFIYRSRNEKF